MGAGGWFILKFLAIGIGVFVLVVIVFVVGCAFILAGRISREEEQGSADYHELVKRLRDAQARTTPEQPHLVVDVIVNPHFVRRA